MANIFKVQTIWTGVAGSPYYTNLFFTSDGLTAGAQAAVDDVNTFLDGLAGGIVLGAVGTIQDEVLEINDATGQIVGSYSTSAEGTVGASTSEALPRFTQGLIQWKTGSVVSGRFLRGRTFVPLPTEAVNGGDGVPSTAYKDLVFGAADGLIASADSQLVIYSPTHNTSRPVTDAAVWGQWAELRSRRD